MSDLTEEPKRLIPELCRHFYTLGWVSGTGGGVSIKKGNTIYVAPSGIQKERIKPDDIFVYEVQGDGKYRISEYPTNKQLKPSECLPLFMVTFLRRDAKCVIHSHSHWANLVTAVGHNLQFVISNQEMIKGIKKGSSDISHRYNETLIVPIIENTAFEKDLKKSLENAVINYPNTNAVLVRNHGVYVWGKSWQSAKSMAECYDYLFRLKIEALRCNIDWARDLY